MNHVLMNYIMALILINLYTVGPVERGEHLKERESWTRKQVLYGSIDEKRTKA